MTSGRLGAVRMGAACAMAVLAMSACSSSGSQRAPESGRSSTSSTASSPITLRGRLGVTQTTSLRPLHLQQGDRVRAILMPSAPLRAVLGIVAQPLSETDVATFTEAVNAGVHGRGTTPPQTSDDVPNRADVYGEGDVESTFPDGTSLLITSPVFRSECDGGQNQWLDFLAPKTATYYLAVLPAAQVNDVNLAGSFAVEYQVEGGHPVDSSGSFSGTVPLSDWYKRAYLSASGYFSDSAFFGSTTFTYGSDPYANMDCTNKSGWAPTP